MCIPINQSIFQVPRVGPADQQPRICCCLELSTGLSNEPREKVLCMVGLSGGGPVAMVEASGLQATGVKAYRSSLHLKAYLRPSDLPERPQNYSYMPTWIPVCMEGIPLLARGLNNRPICLHMSGLPISTSNRPHTTSPFCEHGPNKLYT